MGPRRKPKASQPAEDWAQYIKCQHCRQRHWGVGGAAGLLLVHRNSSFVATHVVLQRRGSIWAIPSGALEVGETPVQAAIREGVEETSLPADCLLGADPLLVVRESVVLTRHSVDSQREWLYTVVICDVRSDSDFNLPRITTGGTHGGTSLAVEWVPITEVDDGRRVLHPEFAAGWRALKTTIGVIARRQHTRYWPPKPTVEDDDEEDEEDDDEADTRKMPGSFEGADRRRQERTNKKRFFTTRAKASYRRPTVEDDVEEEEVKEDEGEEWDPRRTQNPSDARKDQKTNEPPGSFPTHKENTYWPPRPTAEDAARENKEREASKKTQNPTTGAQNPKGKNNTSQGPFPTRSANFYREKSTARARSMHNYSTTRDASTGTPETKKQEEEEDDKKRTKVPPSRRHYPFGTPRARPSFDPRKEDDEQRKKKKVPPTRRHNPFWTPAGVRPLFRQYQDEAQAQAQAQHATGRTAGTRPNDDGNRGPRVRRTAQDMPPVADAFVRQQQERPPPTGRPAAHHPWPQVHRPHAQQEHPRHRQPPNDNSTAPHHHHHRPPSLWGQLRDGKVLELLLLIAVVVTALAICWELVDRALMKSWSSVWKPALDDPWDSLEDALDGPWLPSWDSVFHGPWITNPLMRNIIDHFWD